MLTAHSNSGWRDIQVDNCPDIREAIQVAEAATGCMVSHGRAGVGSAWHPGVTVDAESGQVVRHHDRAAKPEVMMGPPDVMRAIALAIGGSKKNSNARP
jgi:hypothetical protein